MKTNVTKNLKAGFSLVEMLVVIAVIGIIAAIAVPTIGNITSASRVAKNKRNAQNLASVYASALAAGTTTLTGTNAVIAAAIVAGVTGSADTGMSSTTFKVPNMSVDDQTAALAYIDTSFAYSP